jgi:hypothetical protein
LEKINGGFLKPYNPPQNWVPHPPSTQDKHCEFDLDLKLEQRKFFKKEKQRMSLNWHASTA